MEQPLDQKTEEVLSIFARTTDDIFSLEEFKTKLRSGKKMRIKYGVDLTAPFLHLGHAVNLWMMRELQERGHKVVFLLGDYTTLIGDPTGKSETRKMIPPEEIERNAEEFVKQVSLVLITDDPEVFEIRRNSEWFRTMPLEKFLSLLTMVTHARLISRDMFQMRIEQGNEIHMNEMLYPILQGYDSYELISDLTIVGSDQLFNEMMGRFYQQKFDQEPQVIITTKITNGLCGQNKQSKSLGNYVGLVDTPKDKFGKMMSLADDAIIEWMSVYTDIPNGEIEQYAKELAAGGRNPRDYKIKLAKAIVKRYHGAAEADKQEQWFLSTFSNKQFPENAPKIDLDSTEIRLLELLKTCNGKMSNSDLRRLVQQGGVQLDGEKLEDPNATVQFESGKSYELKIGKRGFFKLVTA